MRWRDAVTPLPMTRVAVVAPRWSLREALVRVADAGIVDLDRLPQEEQPPEAATLLLRVAAGRQYEPSLAAEPPDLAALARDGRADLLAGEAELAGYADSAVLRGDVAGLVGWVPAGELPDLAERLAEVGAAVAPLPTPKGVEPPTANRPGTATTAFGPLVRTYATVPYADLDPTVIAGIAYVVMFGAMFGDVGEGALLLLAGLFVRSGRPRILARLRPHWLFISAAGLSSMVFGFLYGECFGPTGLVPTGWLSPMDRPVPMLVFGIGLGAILLAGAYLLGTINRVREGGWAVALYAPSGLAGALLFCAAGLAAWSWYAHVTWLAVAAGVLGVAALVLAFVGLLANAGRTGAGVVQAIVELFDMVVRLGANVLSFARLAAFGLTHAVLGWIVWQATVSLWHSGPLGVAAAIVVFVVGTTLAFALEALVAAVQALRLAYYELFSRVFELEGRPFRPWHLPVVRAAPAAEEAP